MQTCELSSHPVRVEKEQSDAGQSVSLLQAMYYSWNSTTGRATMSQLPV